MNTGPNDMGSWVRTPCGVGRKRSQTYGIICQAYKGKPFSISIDINRSFVHFGDRILL